MPSSISSILTVTDGAPAFLTCLFVGYIIKPKVIVDEVESSGEFKRKSLFLIMVKYIAPICIVAILVFSVLEGLGFITV